MGGSQYCPTEEEIQQQECRTQERTFPIRPPEDHPGCGETKNEGHTDSLQRGEVPHPVLRQQHVEQMRLQKHVRCVFAGRGRMFRLRERLGEENHRFAVDQGVEGLTIFPVDQTRKFQDCAGWEHRGKRTSGKADEEPAVTVQGDIDVPDRPVRHVRVV